LLVGGRGALRRDGALLRHRLRRRATRRIPRGRWRGRLSRWRRRRRRSLRGCRAGCHQSCQDQKKRLSLHGKQMLPRYRCSLPAGETDWSIRSRQIALQVGLGTEQGHCQSRMGTSRIENRAFVTSRTSPSPSKWA
jgi:hypothetical protein